MLVKLTEEEYTKVMDLYRVAQNTPMIAMSVRDGLEGRDWATKAWDRVRDYMDELGKKYGYDPETAVISPESVELEAWERKSDDLGGAEGGGGEGVEGP